MPFDVSPLGALLYAVLGLGGGAGIVGIITAIRGIRTDKWANEGTLYDRLNEDSKQQGLRADRAEARSRKWEDQSGIYRRQLVQAGIDPTDRVWAEELRDGPHRT